MSDMQTMRDMLQEAMALIETVVTTRYDPREVADLNRRAYALMSQQNEPAPEQDEREAFDRWFRPEMNLHPETDTTSISAAFLPYRAWKAALRYAATRPAQTEQQPGAHRECRVIGFRPGVGEVTFYVEDGVPQWMNIGETIYVSDAAPIAQTAPQPQQSGLVLMPKEATPEIVAAMKRELDKAPTWYCRYSAAYRAALSAQGEKHE